MTEERHTTDVTVSFFTSGYQYMLLRHFQVWSNFEIADLDFWRSEAYMKFFTFLDKKGGFYYEVRNAYHKSGS